MSAPETPLFVKTHDFLLWLIQRTLRFPKNLRQSYTLKLEMAAFDFQEAILMANAVRGAERSQWLARADGKLVCLRALLRLAYDLKLLAGTQCEHACQRVDELGRLLGAWKKGTDRKAPVRSV
jgi:23S rRNA-intervening sequence protein